MFTVWPAGFCADFFKVMVCNAKRQLFFFRNVSAKTAPSVHRVIIRNRRFLGFGVFVAAAHNFGNSGTGFSVFTSCDSLLRTDHFIFDWGGEGGWANIFLYRDQ